MNPEDLQDTGPFRPVVLDRFLNGLEPDAEFRLNPSPWRTALAGAALLVATALFWLLSKG